MGTPAPVTTLASLASYPFPDPDAGAHVLRALGALVEACAAVPSVSFASCLVHACGA